MFNSLSEKTGNLASSVWRNANIATAKAALGAVAGTAGAVAGEIGSTIYKQAAILMEWNKKLKETFACYHLEDNGKVYHGTIHFTRNELFFSCEGPLPHHIKNKKGDLPVLPHGEKSWKDNYERRGFVWGIQLTLNWGDIKEINTGGNTENPSERYIEITTHEGFRYIFKGFLNHQKAFAHLYSLLELSSS